MNLDVRSLSISGVRLIKSERIADARGYFAETYVRRDFMSHGIDCDFVQDNQSASDAPGTVRGLHFQVPPFAQAKLVRVLSGSIVDVVVDLRRSSPSYGGHVAIELSAANGDQLLVPVGCAHGFCTLEPQAVVLYKVDAVYSGIHDRGINWADPTLKIAWPVQADKAIVSNKDRALPMFNELPPVFQ
jgi:dTDP-4-dehydrorhamnose 3,5-epimerase